MTTLTGFFGDRIQINSILIVLCFVSVLSLSSQSAASYPTYLLALAMLLTVRQWNDVFRIRLVWSMVLLLSVLSLSAFWSEPFVWREVLSIFSRALLVFLFVVAFAECQLRGQMRRWLRRALAVVGIAAVSLAIGAFLIDLPEDGRLDGIGQLDTPVIAALVYGVVLIFVIEILMTEQSRQWKSMAVAGLVLVVTAVYLSDSRNAWVSVALGATVFILAHLVRDQQRFVAALAAAAVGFAALLLALLSSEGTRDLLLPRGLSFRPEIWTHTLDRIVEQGLIFGVGINSPNDVELGGITFLHPHNLYLSVLFQGGLVAVCLLLVLLYGTLAELMRHYHHSDAKLALGILGIALPAYLLDGHELIDKVGSTWFLLWLPIAVALGLRWGDPASEL